MDWRQSIRETLHFGRPDGICQFEWGYWPETIERWKREGMPGEKPWEALPITYYHRAPVQVRIYPPFEEQLLSETAETRTIRDGAGGVREVSKIGTRMPRFIKFPVENLRDFEKLKERLDPHDPRRFPADWDAQAATLAGRNSVLVLGHTEISFFGWHRDLMGVENLLLAYYDQPELIHAISRHHLDFIRTIYSRVMEKVEGDFVFIWEDMSFKNGPLISPALVREFMMPYYRELIGFFREHRPYKFLLDSDGDVRQLMPLWREVGIDGCLPFEVAAGMDVRKIREAYPGMVLCGGIDKREIAKGRAAIDRELEAKLPFMFERGGYLPSMDHHVPPEVSYADFQYYLAKTRELYAKYGV